MGVFDLIPGLMNLNSWIYPSDEDYRAGVFLFTNEMAPITKNSAIKFAIRNAMAAKSAIG